ncbi:MAG: M23 family metallopeptidase [Candidatus Cloacimonetes bacterium]|nr:M23 family metallopeptidase [Candidatus Cloacimonadota bacterium]
MKIENSKRKIMETKRRIFINISNTDSTSTKSYSISEMFLKLLLTVPLLIGIAITVSIIYVTASQTNMKDYNKLAEENSVLRKKLVVLSTDLDSIRTKLQLIEQWEDEIRQKNNMDVISKDLREQGIGGLPQIDYSLVSYDSLLSNLYNDILKSMLIVNAKVNYDLQTITELGNVIDEIDYYYRYTPSIYPAFGRISDAYGWRKDPFTSKRTFHRGLDIANQIGTPVYATADGVVKACGNKKFFGRYIEIDHAGEYLTKYAHLNKAMVKPGDSVKRGQIIALMGNSGRSTGVHLHYEVIRNNKNKNPYHHLTLSKNNVLAVMKKK